MLIIILPELIIGLSSSAPNSFSFSADKSRDFLSFLDDEDDPGVLGLDLGLA
jgi:hypothetical protein